MTIRASSATEVERLIAHLRHPGESEREAAVARLRIIGVRALGRLTPVALNEAEPASARVAALQALEDVDDIRARAAALAAAESPDPAVVTAAIAVLRPWLRRDDGALVERLATLATAQRRSATAGAAILNLLAEVHGSAVTVLQQRVGATRAKPEDERPFPPHLDAAREWLERSGDVPLSVLHDFVMYARQQEQATESVAGRDGWRAARAIGHARLASRASTVALYDLRESFAAAAAPLPLDFLVAITAIGDASCLEPMAQAWASAPAETWWRDRLSGAAAAIIKRGRLSGKSPIVKRLRAKYVGFV